MVVVDTDVVSYIFKRHPAAQPFVRALDGRRLYVSFMTVAEIEHGMIVAKWGEPRRMRMRSYLTAYIIHQSDPLLCHQWGEVIAESAARGKRMSHEDAWIAASALQLGAPLATNNRKDFTHLKLLSLLLP